MSGQPARTPIGAVYGAGLLQGLALVTFPAASAVFTSPQSFALSNAEYGLMFAPQTATAIAAALLGGRLARRWGQKRVLLFGLAANLASMAILVASHVVMGAHTAAFGVLLAATAAMGVGFGLTVPALNTLAAGLFPRRVDAALLALNALLGLGTALAPLFVTVFIGLGIWWGLPLAVGAGLAALFAGCLFLRLDVESSGDGARAPSSPAFWLFAGFALCYGVVETLNGNWAILYMKGVLNATAKTASIALALFWAAMTAGRVLFAGVGRWLPGPVAFRLLPGVVGVAFVATALAPASPSALGLSAFGLAGLGCSALLPLTLSLGARVASAGALIACYQVGYGLAAFGLGPLHDRAGFGLRPLFGGAAIVAVMMTGLSIAIVATTRRARR